MTNGIYGLPEDRVDFCLQLGRNFAIKVVIGGQADTAVRQRADVDAAAGELTLGLGFDHRVDGIVQALHAGGDEDVLLVGQGVVLVHVHADAPLAVLLSRRQATVAGLAAHAKDDVYALVDERLAACVNIIPSVESLYRWQGHVHHDQEVLLVAKTAAVALQRLAKRVKQLHSYDTPEIIALPIVAGAEDYLRWMDEETQSAGASAKRIEIRTDSE